MTTRVHSLRGESRETAAGPDTEPARRCPAPETVVAAVLEDATNDAAQAAVLRHADQCSVCRGLSRETGALLDTMRRGDPAAAGSAPALPDRGALKLWRRTRPGHWGFSFSVPAALRVAAAVLLLVGAGYVALRQRAQNGTRPMHTRIDRGMDWLIANQTPSGAWDVTALGGKAAFTPALNGLALLALAQDRPPSPERRAAMERAADYLLTLQSADGRFGGQDDGLMYNHGIATLALLETYSVTGLERLPEPIDAALAFMLDRQTVSGGWAYSAASDAQPNTSITAWQVQALLAAARSGLRSDTQALRRAVAWLAGTVGGGGYFGYERPGQFPEGPNTLTMMGAYCVLAVRHMEIPVDPALTVRVLQSIDSLAGENPHDYYGTFFHTAALREADASGFDSLLTRVYSALVQRQVTAGNEAGTWRADDQWSETGGRLYSTAMALMALKRAG